LIDTKSTVTNHELVTGRNIKKLTDKHYNQILDSSSSDTASGRTILDHISNADHLKFSPETLHKIIDNDTTRHHVVISNRKEIQPDHIQRLLDMKNSRIDQSLAKSPNLTHDQKWELLHRGSGEGSNRMIHNNLILLNHLDPKQEEHIFKHGTDTNKEDLAFTKSLLNER
jgi:hypothetical protein